MKLNCEDIFLKHVSHNKSDSKNISLVKKFVEPEIQINLNKSVKPIIIGAGPSGLFSALTFIKYGYKPIIIEQGEAVEQRQKTVNTFLLQKAF